MCDYWMGRAMSAKNRGEADTYGTCHDIFYDRYPALGLLNRPFSDRGILEDCGLGERDPALVTQGAKDPQHVLYVPDFGQINPELDWGPSETCVPEDGGILGGPFDSGYLDNIGASIGNSDPRRAGRKVARPKQNGEGSRGRPRKIEAEQRGLQGYGLPEQNVLLYEDGLPVRQFVAEQQSSIFGAFDPRGYMPHPVTALNMNPLVVLDDPGSEQDYMLSQCQKRIIRSPITQHTCKSSSDDQSTCKSSGDDQSREKRDFIARELYTPKSRSPAAPSGGCTSQKRPRKGKCSLVSASSDSPPALQRSHEKKQPRGRKPQQLSSPAPDAEQNPGVQRVTSDVTANEYCRVRVFEVTCNNVPVMLRKSDGYMNATQILKAAGIEKGRRIRILDREVARSSHEKVQGGCGKYQGTWVPFEKGVHLASTYGIDRELRSLFDLQRASTAPQTP